MDGGAAARHSQPAWISHEMELGQLPGLEFSFLFSKKGCKQFVFRML